MNATALIHRRVVLAVDAFVEVAVWRVERSVPPSKHGFKYRLAYVVAGRHVGSVETPYAFTTPDQLMADFSADIERWNHEHGRS